jgi:hypothetical protein
MTDATTRNKSYTHGHVAFFYSSLEERIKQLVEYFSAGLAQNELCLYATPGSVEQAIGELTKAGLNASAAVDKGIMRIFEMNATYMPDGVFASNYMLANVAQFIEDAKRMGYSGLRTAGEMRWINSHPEYANDAAHYENDVNGLCAEHHDFLGLCLYPITPDFDIILQKALRSHPAFIYDGHLRVNPYAGNTQNPDSTEPVEMLLARA